MFKRLLDMEYNKVDFINLVDYGNDLHGFAYVKSDPYLVKAKNVFFQAYQNKDVNLEKPIQAFLRENSHKYDKE